MFGPRAWTLLVPWTNANARLEGLQNPRLWFNSSIFALSNHCQLSTRGYTSSTVFSAASRDDLTSIVGAP